jgi:hypothetical protein
MQLDDRLGDDQLGDVDGHVQDALDLDQRALGGDLRE